MMDVSTCLSPSGPHVDTTWTLGLQVHFSYENKLKKEYLLTATNEIQVHLDSAGIPLIFFLLKAKKQNTLKKENGSHKSLECYGNSMMP